MPSTGQPLGQDSEHDGADADGQRDAAAQSDLVSRYGPVADDSRAQPHDVIVARPSMAMRQGSLAATPRCQARPA